MLISILLGVFSTIVFAMIFDTVYRILLTYIDISRWCVTNPAVISKLLNETKKQQIAVDENKFDIYWQKQSSQQFTLHSADLHKASLNVDQFFLTDFGIVGVYYDYYNAATVFLIKYEHILSTVTDMPTLSNGVVSTVTFFFRLAEIQFSTDFFFISSAKMHELPRIICTIGYKIFNDANTDGKCIIGKLSDACISIKYNYRLGQNLLPRTTAGHFIGLLATLYREATCTCTTEIETLKSGDFVILFNPAVKQLVMCLFISRQKNELCIISDKGHCIPTEKSMCNKTQIPLNRPSVLKRKQMW